MRELVSAVSLETTVANLYELVNESLSLDLIDNEVSVVYIGIFVGRLFFRFRECYELLDITGRVSEDILAYFVNLQESLGSGDDEIAVDSIIVIVE